MLWVNGQVEIRKTQVETLLKEGTEVDENLDDIEKVVEVLKLWIKGKVDLHLKNTII